jgi:hypothetical protein
MVAKSARGISQGVLAAKALWPVAKIITCVIKKDLAKQGLCINSQAE